MKTRKDYMLRKISDDYYILAPTGAAAADSNGLIKFSETGAFVWQNLDSVKDLDELVAKALEEYDVDEETARRDIGRFVDSLRKRNMIEE